MEIQANGTERVADSDAIHSRTMRGAAYLRIAPRPAAPPPTRPLAAPGQPYRPVPGRL
jgi:hypothetical protein